jgi:hypothetical protein
MGFGDMNGIRIRGKKRFRELFSPIFPQLRGLTWITRDQAFQLPAAWIDESSFDEASESFTSGPCAEFEQDVSLLSEGAANVAGPVRYGFSSRSDLFPKYADAIAEDWNAIFGFRAPIDDPLAWLKGYYDTGDRAAYVSEAEVCFLNIDAAFWEFYARDPRLIETLRSHLRGPGVSVDDCVLEDTFGL